MYAWFMTAQKPRQDTKIPIQSFDEVKRDYIQMLMHATQGNIFKACQASGLTRATIYRLIAKYGIQRRN